MDGVRSLTSSDWVCQLRWANKKSRRHVRRKLRFKATTPLPPKPTGRAFDALHLRTSRDRNLFRQPRNAECGSMRPRLAAGVIPPLPLGRAWRAALY
jgi:hypothetical protein